MRFRPSNPSPSNLALSERALHTFPPGVRRLPHSLPERPHKVHRRAKTRESADVLHRPLRSSKQIPSLCHSLIEQVLVRGLARGAPEFASEVIGTKITFLGHLSRTQILSKVLVHVPHSPA